MYVYRQQHHRMTHETPPGYKKNYNAHHPQDGHNIKTPSDQFTINVKIDVKSFKHATKALVSRNPDYGS